MASINRPYFRLWALCGPWLLGGLLGYALAPVALAKKPKPPTSVADLRFGVALYDYYQNKHLDALSELLVAEARGGIQGHGDTPRIMAGGFYMAYGMERTASEIFTRLLDDKHSQKTRDAAWFYLARMAYLRGDWAATEVALTNVSAEPDADLANDILALRCNLLTRKDDAEGASRIIRQLEGDSSWLPYLYYNLGSVYGRKGEFSKAVDTYNRLLGLHWQDVEYLALYDKAMTSAGFGYLLNKKYEDAIVQFSRVRLNSPVSSRALLGYGWAAAENGNYAQALRPWEELSQRSLIDESVQESLVAIPYAYEKLGRKQEALTAYRKAETTYSQEVNSLAESLKTLAGDAILDVLKIDPTEEVSWSAYAANNQLAPQKAYLAQLFSQEDFQSQVQGLRDLLAMQRSLLDWQDRMRLYNDMLDERDINRDAQMSGYAKRNYAEDLAQLTRSRNQLAAQLETAKANQNVTMLLTGKAAARHSVVELSQQRLARLQAAGQATPEQQQKLHLYAGLDLWDAQENYAQNLFELEENLKVADRELQAVNSTWNAVVQQVGTGQDLQPYRVRLGLARNRIDAQLREVNRAIDGSKEALRGQILVVLADQRDRINQYLAQSRLAIARLLDQATGEKY